MERTLLLIGFVLLSAALNICNCMVIAEERSNWLHEVSKPLVRHERDLGEDSFVNVTDWGENMPEENVYCTQFLECSSQFFELVGKFRIAEVKEHLDEWCKKPSSCWNDQCDDEGLMRQAEATVGIQEWMCHNKEGFQDTTCYQAPFPQRMQACSRSMEGLHDSTVQEIMWSFRQCVLSTLDQLPGCSRDSFFVEFFDIVMSEQQRINEIN